MTEQTLESFVQERKTGAIKKPTSWVEDGVIYDGVNDDPWTAEDLTAEAIGAGLIPFDMSWDEAVASVKKIMESIDG